MKKRGRHPPIEWYNKPKVARRVLESRSTKVERPHPTKPDKKIVCWEFTGALHVRTGYARVQLFPPKRKTKNTSYHVIAACVRENIPWSERKNTRGSEIQCSHLCRNRKCINPAHIRFETRQENNQRKVTCNAPRLTQDEVTEIIDLRERGMSQNQISDIVGRIQPTISRLLCGHTHVNEVQIAKERLGLV